MVLRLGDRMQAGQQLGQRRHADDQIGRTGTLHRQYH
jgi:hypothetical protein